MSKLMAYLRPRAPFTDPSGDKGWWRAISRPQNHEVTRLTLDIGGWRERSAPLRLAVLSDIHLGSHSDDIARLKRIVGEVNAARPDIVLLPGDFVNTQIVGGGRIPPDTIAALLAGLNSPLGTFAVLGNHDWHYDGEAVWRALEDAGIRVMENDSCRVSHHGGDFWITGLADHQTRRPDFDAAIGDRAPQVPRLVMAHDPASFAQIPRGPFLTVSGHTHGGQFGCPGSDRSPIPAARHCAGRTATSSRMAVIFSCHAVWGRASCPSGGTAGPRFAF